MDKKKYTLEFTENEIKLILRGLDRLFDTAVTDEREEETSKLYKQISEKTGVKLY